MNEMTSMRTVSTGLRVEVIDGMPGLHALEHEWKALEDRDPLLTVFLSWDWLQRAFANNPYRWSVLAVREKARGKLVCLLPLKYRVHWSTSRNEFQTELEAGGRLLFSEYTGFLCDPRYEAAAMRALARHLRSMPWTKLSMRYVAQQERTALFCEAFEHAGYTVTHKEYRINKGETDNLISPKVTLPETFEEYLEASVSSNTRQNYRRFQRKHFADGAYHFTHCDEDSFDEDVEILLDFWKQKWRATKGKSAAEKVASNFQSVLEAAISSDALFLPVLWRDDTPLGALGHVMDPKAGTMHFIIAGRDTGAPEAFIGSALHFHSIECAILLGCEFYDFGHGDEPYKFSYGADRTKLQYFSISRGEADKSKVFDLICIGAALKRVEGFIAADKKKEAERACQQLSGLFK